MTTYDPAVEVTLFFVGVLLALITWGLYKRSLDYESKKGDFGSPYGWFVALGIFTVVYWTQLPWFQKGPPVMMGAWRNFVAGVVHNFHDKSAATTTGGATSAATPVPTGSPNDYIEWPDNLHVQPKAGAAPLNGWTVTVIPVDAAKVDSRQRVTGPITVLPEEYRVYFDPDPSWGIRGTVPVPATLRPAP